MYVKKERNKKDQFSLSQYFELTCESILEELDLMLPCECWLIAYQEQNQWSALYTMPINIVEIDHLSTCLEVCQANPHGVAACDHMSNSSYIGAALTAKDSIFSGAILGYKPQSTSLFPEEIARLIRLFAKVISCQLETEFKLNHQKYKIQQLINLSHTDSLTQLLNHRAWSQLLTVEEARAKRYQQVVTIFIIDLDKLKIVNDTQGHHIGDSLIVKAANCLRDVCRESDLVARLGGDEFGLLAIECDEIGAKVLLQNINKVFSEALIDASVGYCVMKESMNILDAVNIADEKMYKDKNNKNEHLAQSITLPSTEIFQ